jgi:valyl-tRNA synthetase
MDPKFAEFEKVDNKLAEERDNLLREITREMDDFKFYIVAEKLYHYSWHTLADVILEESKKVFVEGTDKEKASRKQFLLQTLEKILIVLHPFMPFVTEEIWQTWKNDHSILMVREWPNSVLPQ